MRIAIGSYIQESHSFAPTVGRWEDFREGQLCYGSDVIEGMRGTATEVNGAVDVAEARGGVTLLPLLRAMQRSSTGPIERVVHEGIRDDMNARLRDAHAQAPLDGVFLSMHGAMCADGYDDATGDVIRAAREVVGSHVPIVVTLDLHANITHRMATVSDALVGYLTFPHIDLYETGQRGMQLLLRAIETKTQPVNVVTKLPMIVSAENAQTTRGVIHDLLQSALAHIGHDGILDVSFFPMQPWLDIPEAGCAIVAVAEPEHVLDAELLVNALADAWWLRREEHAVNLASTDAIISEALASERKPWVFSDSADAPSSGAPGDSSVTIAALLRANPQKDCYANIVDPAAVAKMIDAGVGNEVTVTLGASSGTSLYSPIKVTGKVRLISDGDFIHRARGLQGQTMRRGRTAVLQCGHVFVVVMELAVLQWDRELYKSVGLDPADAQIVIVKSPAGFRADYEPIAATVRVLDAPGVCTPILTSLPFTRIPRPMWPFDEVSR
jgi:microcystin degradation protein MlrC